MKHILATFALAAALIASAAHAQESVGHIAWTGNSVEFEGGSLNNSTLVSSGRYIYEFNGLGGSWTRIFRPAVAPEGLGVTTLPDGRRCVFWIESENLRVSCELTARQENWGAIQTWPQPPVSGSTLFRFKRIAVLGPVNEAGVASGQIPMVFAIAHNSHLLLVSLYRNGRWGYWQQVASLFLPTGNTPSRPADISATWDPNCSLTPMRVLVNVVGTGYHRLWIVPGTNENSAPFDVSHTMPTVGEPILRMAPYAQSCGTDPLDDGYSFYVTASGALIWTNSYLYGGHTDMGQIAVPSPVRAVHARGNKGTYRLYIEDINGLAWMASIRLINFDLVGPAEWTLLE